MLIKLTRADTSNLFFTSDHHFAHANIIKFCDRPFADVQEMDAVLIDRWNEVVPPDGLVFHLGDFTLMDGETANEYFRLLNGRIKVLSNPWHHDKRWSAEERAYTSRSGHPVELLPPMVVLEIHKADETTLRIGSVVITLCHYPLAEWDRKHYNAWHLHGHSHGRHQYPEPVFALDVGVDINEWGFAPVSFERISEGFFLYGPRESLASRMNAALRNAFRDGTIGIIGREEEVNL